MTSIHSKILHYFFSAAFFGDIENIQFTSDGLKYAAVNDENTVYVDAVIPKETFSTYDIEPCNVNVKVKLLAKLLKDVDGNVEIKKSKKENLLSFYWENSEFRVPVVEEVRRPTEPKFEKEVKAEVNAKDFRKAVQYAATISPFTQMIAHKKGFYVAGQTSNNEVLTKLDAKIEGTGTAFFRSSYLNQIVKLGTDDDNVIIEMAKDLPIKLSYNILNLMTLNYYVAPIIFEDVYVEDRY